MTILDSPSSSYINQQIQSPESMLDHHSALLQPAASYTLQQRQHQHRLQNDIQQDTYKHSATMTPPRRPSMGAGNGGGDYADLQFPNPPPPISKRQHGGSRGLNKSGSPAPEVPVRHTPRISVSPTKSQITECIRTRLAASWRKFCVKHFELIFSTFEAQLSFYILVTETFLRKFGSIFFQCRDTSLMA